MLPSKFYNFIVQGGKNFVSQSINNYVKLDSRRIYLLCSASIDCGADYEYAMYSAAQRKVQLYKTIL